MIKKIGTFTFVIFSSLVSHAEISGKTLKIGVLSDMAGPYADMCGPGSVRAAELAVEDFQKKFPGQKVEIVSADHQNKADLATSIANKWFDVEGVDMITDLGNSAVALAVQNIAKEKNRVSMVVAAGSSELTGKSCSPNGVHWAFDSYAMAHGTSQAVVKSGGKSWYFITADYAFGHSLEKDSMAAVNSFGGKVVGSVRHPFPGQDFSSFLLKASSSKADVIAFANAGSDAINSIKQAAEFGLGRKSKARLVALLMFITDIHSLGLEVTQGLTITDGFYWDLNDETRAWSKRFAAKHKGRMPSMVQAGVYSAVTHYLNAAMALKSDEASKVMAQMRKTPINDFFAKNGKLREDGRMIHDMYLMQVKAPAESKAPWDYYKLLSTIPANEAFRPLAQSECPLVKK